MKHAIGEHYNTARDATEQFIQQVTEDAVNASGFEIEKLLFKGVVYEDSKVGTLIYVGVYNNEPAVLKIQVLDMGISEVDIMNDFAAQNTSTVVRMPDVLAEGKAGNDDYQYWFVMEHIEGESLYNLDSADSEASIHAFITYYKEYRANSLQAPFVPTEKVNFLEYTSQRVDLWHSIGNEVLQKQGLPAHDMHVLAMLDEYKKFAQDAKLDMEFQHKHLTANDITHMNGEMIIMSNLFWGDAPRLYDLTFHIWHQLNRETLTAQDAIRRFELWHDAYHRADIFTNDTDRKAILINMMNRALGSILVDIPSNKTYTQEQREQKNQMFTRLFEHLTEKYNNL